MSSKLEDQTDILTKFKGLNGIFPKVNSERPCANGAIFDDANYSIESARGHGANVYFVAFPRDSQ